MATPINDPLVFEPIPMERVWGGRRLDVMYGKHLPPGVPIGEIWEIVDREEAQSLVHSGRCKGLTLNKLWNSKREQIFGKAYTEDPRPRFPLLIKLLDAREKLSVQVHPPAKIAPALGGEPKTEVWYFARCAPDAVIYAGIKNGISRVGFEKLLREGTVEKGLHAISVREGDSIFIPSGRLHAIGGGNVIVEIQQNSDTTFRVFDWNRQGLDGRPRQLHIEESLACIDFEDVEPDTNHIEEGLLAKCPHFKLEKRVLKKPFRASKDGKFAIVTLLEGTARCGSLSLPAGSFCLVPACAPDLEIVPEGRTCTLLLTTLPVARGTAREA